MELEEAIKILNDLKENVALFPTGWYPILKECERQALEIVFKYIKEESVPKTVVKEKIKELDKKAKQELKGVKGQDRYFIKQIYHSKRSFLKELLEEE